MINHSVILIETIYYETSGLNSIKPYQSGLEQHELYLFSFYFSTVLYDIIHKHLIKNQFLYRMTKNYLLYFHSFCIVFFFRKKNRH